MTTTFEEWRTSSFSNDGTNCVELSIATNGDAVAVRDTKDRNWPALVFTRAEWAAFLAGAKNGEFDPAG
jgi:hypothetical protein